MEDKKEELRVQRSQPEKPEAEKEGTHSGMVLGMCLGLAPGLALGVAVGVATRNLGLWMPVGMCLGLALGMSFYSEKKQKDDGNDDPQA